MADAVRVTAGAVQAMVGAVPAMVGAVPAMAGVIQAVAGEGRTDSSVGSAMFASTSQLDTRMQR